MVISTFSIVVAITAAECAAAIMYNTIPFLPFSVPLKEQLQDWRN